MVPENKQNRRYKQINFIGLQNNRLLALNIARLYSPGNIAGTHFR
jgi:hypothetical protein